MKCPNCGNKGNRVKRITLDSLLRDDAKSRIVDTQYYFCDSPECDIVYFSEAGSTFVKDDLTVRIGVKEKPGSGPRLVCYCFDHTIEEIEEEVKGTGGSTALDDIKTRMKDGCFCETVSPMGGCCLGTVSKYIKAAVNEHGESNEEAGNGTGDHVEEDHTDCCAGGAGGMGGTGRVAEARYRKARHGNDK